MSDEAARSVIETAVRERIDEAVAAERERCLKIIGRYGGADFREIEEAIRAGE
jgi:hypothetical protein